MNEGQEWAGNNHILGRFGATFARNRAEKQVGGTEALPKPRLSLEPAASY
jgi:hypothetical protein